MTARLSEEIDRPLYVSSDLAIIAPYVRNSLDIRKAMQCVVLATAPCVVMAFYNTGYQANLALASGIPAAGWRTKVLGALGLGHSPSSAADCMIFGALFFLPLFASVWLAAGISERVFAWARGRPVNHVALPAFAILFSLCLPASLPTWQAAVGSAAGIIIGKEIFGGFGRNFVHPVVVGLAFLLFAYPGVLSGDGIWVPVPGHALPTILSTANQFGFDGVATAGFTWSSAAFGWVPGAMGETSALACGVGFLFLLYAGVISWRIVAGGFLGMVVSVHALQTLQMAVPIAELPWHWHLVSGNFAFGIIYLATDPVTAATTNPSRWLYGALIGAFVAVVRIANPSYQEGMILAVLLGNVTAPLLDRIVAFAQLRLNRAKHD